MKSKKPDKWFLAQKRIKEWIKENKVLDVVVFGSFVRSKMTPNDIDLCIIINERDEGKSLDFVSSLSKDIDSIGLKFQINVLTERDFILGKSLLAHTLLSEGISINGFSISKLLGYDQFSLFTYSLRHFSSSKRVRFHYLLAGRDGGGILKEIGGKIVGGGAILAPTCKEDFLSEIFKMWDVDFSVKRVLIER